MSYIVSCRIAIETKDAIRYRPESTARSKLAEKKSGNRRRRSLPPNFLLCRQCFWIASQVYFGMEDCAECPVCGHRKVSSQPIWKLETNTRGI